LYGLLKIRDLLESDRGDYIIEKIDLEVLLSNLLKSGDLNQTHIKTLLMFAEGYKYEELDSKILLHVLSKIESYFRSESIINQYLEKYSHYKVIRNYLIKYTLEEELLCQF